MSDNSAIEWTDATWNPLLGCTKVSPGCDGCYAIVNARIREANPTPKIATAYAGLVERDDAGQLDWTGRVNLLPDRLDQPLRWRKARLIFVNSQSDLFHDSVPDEFIAKVFAVMSQAPQHTFQLLTKRHGRMRSLLSSSGFGELVQRAIDAMYDDPDDQHIFRDGWPFPNVWLGVSVEDQKHADLRIPALLETPAAVRFLSCEPLLGPVDLDSVGGISALAPDWAGGPVGGTGAPHPLIDWVIVGGESGKGARPMHPDWARTLRDQCTAASVPFHFKQWGEWGPAPWVVRVTDTAVGWTGVTEELDAAKAEAERLGATHAYAVWAHQHGHEPHKASHRPWSLERTQLDCSTHASMRRWGKKAAGRLLDGRTWDEFPMAVAA